MPDIKTDDGCIIHVEVEGPQNMLVDVAGMCRLVPSEFDRARSILPAPCPRLLPPGRERPATNPGPGPMSKIARFSN